MSVHPQHEVEERRAKIARYVARGLSYADIATLVGVTSTQVYRDYTAWAKQRSKRLNMRQDAAYLEVLNGLDETVRRAWEQISDEKTAPKVVNELLATISKTLERKARLMGLLADRVGGPVTNNFLSLVHPAAAASLQALSPQEAEVIEAEVLALPDHADD